MGQIVIVDTSVFLNILDVPGKNQDRKATLDAFQHHLDARNRLYLPVPCIIETGNHITHLTKGHDRYKYAEFFFKEVTKAINGGAPWMPVALPHESNDDIQRWLVNFPNAAKQKISLTDVTVKDLFDVFCKKFSMSGVLVWSLDGHLTSLQRPASSS